MINGGFWMGKGKVALVVVEEDHWAVLLDSLLVHQLDPLLADLLRVRLDAERLPFFLYVVRAAVKCFFVMQVGMECEGWWWKQFGWELLPLSLVSLVILGQFGQW